MPYNVCASAHEVNLLLAKVQTKVTGQELPEFEIVAEDFLVELPVSELSPFFCGSAVHTDRDPTGASGDPCCREERGLLWSLLPHRRHWPSLGRTGGVGNTVRKGESKSSNLEDRGSASNLKYFGAILEAVFCPSKQHYRRKKSQQKVEYQPLEYLCVQCNEESGFSCWASGSPCLSERHPVGCSSPWSPGHICADSSGYAYNGIYFSLGKNDRLSQSTYDTEFICI